MKIFILVTTLILSFSVYASDPTTGNVRFIGGYGDGSSFIDIDQTINEATCPSARVYIVTKGSDPFNMYIVTKGSDPFNT